jgi:pyruvate dehydrogenase E1 component
MLYYREATDGQILEEGITEAGALASWTAAATSYSVHGLAMMPFYIYYSMFGFQRVGDQIWAAADQRARGFLIGATAGRTTLGGEGLQHQDGSSHLVAATVPNCRAWDPATAGELAVIVEQGMREMLEQQRDVFHYVTVGNENQPQPSLPAGVEADLLRGLYRARPAPTGLPSDAPRVTLVGSGSLLAEATAAAELLAAEHGVAAEVMSATSWSELARDGAACERAARLDGATGVPHVERMLAGSDAPVVAVSDWVRAVPESIRAFVPRERRYVVLGTDGFGRSDTRAELRAFFEVDAASIAHAAVHALHAQGRADGGSLAKARARLAGGEAPWRR